MAVFDFKKTEESVLKFWEDHKIFEKSLERRKRAKKFVFFEGPPTANGRPGIHHFIGRAYKDLFNRYKTMRGFFVLRKAGWDTHGLPVEIQVEKELGFKSKKDIEEYGIAAFNRKCKESVWQYKTEWEQMTRRMAFWVDLKHPYITYENYYIESLWAILKNVWDRQLLYLAHKVVPFCTRCGTPLSSHEVAQGYKKVTERSVYIKFKLKDKKFGPHAYILAWTTTPWTLPGNVALAVGKDIDYVVVQRGKEKYVVAKELAEKVLGLPLTAEQEFKGSELAGLSYEPLFEVEKLKSPKSYRVYEAPFVSTGDGTGVVHTAVMYGEDDYDLGTKVGLPKEHTVTEQGKFTGLGKEWDGLYVKSKETEDKIVKYLDGNGLVLKTEDYEHDYPFCWRCSTPLLYYAKNSWFIRMSSLKDKMLAANQTVNWTPEHIREGRFGQWLKEGKDWAISRERYWGTPLPVWKCVKCDRLRVVGSIDGLAKNAVGSDNAYHVLRHGLSDRLEKSKLLIGSRLESDKYHLTEEGAKQASKSLEKLAAAEEKIDLIYTSPFLRTKETAQLAGKLLHCEVKEDNRLGEIAESLACEGRPWAECAFKGARAEHGFDHRPGDGESWNDNRRRLSEFMEEMETKHRGKNILIVSHGDPIWLLWQMAGGLDERQVTAKRKTSKDWYPKFGELKKLQWKELPRNELGELDLHRPYIDGVEFKCDSCGAAMRRIPDLADVWFDSGAMPYAQWHWPFENEKTFKEQFPADFIAEAIDQTRGWFYTLLAVSALLEKGAPYKNVLCYGHVLDEKGQKMSKSKGNIVLPGEVMDEFGVDTARWYFYTLNAPGDYKLFSKKEVRERLTGFMATLQNCVRFYELYANSHSKPEPGSPKQNLLDKWILSRLNNAVHQATDSLDAYDPTGASRALEKFVIEDLSNWWLRRSRKRPEALALLRSLLLEVAKLLAPFVPYVAEDIHMRLHAGAKAGTESVHLHDWPSVQKRAVNLKLEDEMKRGQEAVTAGLALRKEKQLKVRQPLAAAIVTGKKFDKDLEALIAEELNVKEVRYQKSGELALDTVITPGLRAEGFARETIRQVQDMRKEAGYAFDRKVYCQWFTADGELSAALFTWAETVKKETMLSEFIKLQHDDRAYDVEKEFEIAPGKKIWLGVKK